MNLLKHQATKSGWHISRESLHAEASRHVGMLAAALSVAALAACATARAIPQADHIGCAPAATVPAEWHEGAVPEMGVIFRYPATYHRVWFELSSPGYVSREWRQQDSLPADFSFELLPAPDSASRNRAAAALREGIQSGALRNFRECTASAPGIAVLYVFESGSAVYRGRAYTPHQVEATWTLPDGRVVRFTGSGADSSAQQQLLAIARSVRITAR